MRKQRIRSKRKITKKRKAKNVAHAIRALLLEGLGAAVLVFLFLTTRLTPEQLENYSFTDHDHSNHGAESRPGDDTAIQGPTDPDSRNQAVIAELNHQLPFQDSTPIIDLNSRYQTVDSGQPLMNSSPLRPSWASSNQGVATHYSSRRHQEPPRSPNLNW